MASWVERILKEPFLDRKAIVCSECGTEAIEDDSWHYLTHYCPYCGAEMDNPNNWLAE